MLHLGPGNPGCQQLNTTDPVNGICEVAIFLDSFVALPVSLTRKASLLQSAPTTSGCVQTTSQTPESLCANSVHTCSTTPSSASSLG